MNGLSRVNGSQAEELARRTWLAFTDISGDTEPEPEQYDWQSLVGRRDPATALGAVLLWLRSNTDQYKAANVRALLARVEPRHREAAIWLTMHLLDEIDDPEWSPTVKANRAYKEQEKVWLALLRQFQNVNIAAVLRAAKGDPDLQRLLRAAFLREFHANRDLARVIVDMVSHYPDLHEWCADTLLYPPLAAAAREIDIRMPLYLTTHQRKDLAKTWGKTTNVLAARGRAPAALDEPARRVAPTGSVEPLSCSIMSVLYADDLVSQCEIPVDVAGIASQHGIPIHEFRDNGELWEGVVRWDDIAGCPAVGINIRSDLSVARRRFTLAHELAHVFLNSVRLDVIESAQDMFSGKPAEREADRFASRVLVPRNRLSRELLDRLDANVIARLAKKYDVSTQAMAVAIVEIKQDRAVIVTRMNQILWTWPGQGFPKLQLRPHEQLPETKAFIGPAEAADKWLAEEGYSLRVTSLRESDSEFEVLLVNAEPAGGR